MTLKSLIVLRRSIGRERGAGQHTPAAGDCGTRRTWSRAFSSCRGAGTRSRRLLHPRRRRDPGDRLERHERRRAVKAGECGHEPKVYQSLENYRARRHFATDSRHWRCSTSTRDMPPGRGRPSLPRSATWWRPPMLLVPAMPFTSRSPSGCSWMRVAQHEVLAWNASRAARRAITDSLPLLMAAQSVSVVIVDAGKNALHGEAPGADIANFLSRHRVATHVEHVAFERNAPIAERDPHIRRRQQNPTCCVVGAYSHSQKARAAVRRSHADAVARGDDSDADRALIRRG